MGNVNKRFEVVEDWKILKKFKLISRGSHSHPSGPSLDLKGQPRWMMLDDSDDFTEPTKRGATSGKTAKRSKSGVKEKANHVVLVHPKWETAPFVAKLRSLLQESNVAGEQQLVQFKSEVISA